nr:2Fe-2S iron-sulfur cluster-binding protein [Hyphomonas sp.]
MAGGPPSYSGKRQKVFKTLHALTEAELPRWRIIARSVAEAGEADDFVASFLEQLVEAVALGRAVYHVDEVSGMFIDRVRGWSARRTELSIPMSGGIDHEGEERSIDAAAGETVMEVAVKNSVPGIVAECGGACACATCHVYIDEAYADRLEPAGEVEQSMLEFAEDVQANSRLSCQITVSEGLDGLRVTTPESQH